MKDYNFFSIYSKRHKQGIDFKSPYVIGVLVVALFTLLTVGFVAKNMIVERQIQGLQTEIDAIKASSDYAEAEKLRVNIETMQQYDINAQVALAKFEDAKVLGTSFLQKVAGAVPAGVAITGITANSAVVQIGCTVPTRKVAAEFQLYLKDSSLFQSVHMSSVEAAEGTGFTADIECIIGKVGEAE